MPERGDASAYADAVHFAAGFGDPGDGLRTYYVAAGTHVERYPAPVTVALRYRGREFHHAVREAAIAVAPGWLGDIFWPFPTWRVRTRPFDWRID